MRDGTQIVTAVGDTYTVQPVDQGRAISCQVTAANGGGEYTVSGLTTGSYKVEASSPYCEWCSIQPNYLAIYYDGKNTLNEADTVTATTGATHPGVNIAMPAAGEVSGTVISAATRQPIPNVRACVSPLPEGGASCATTNQYGEYLGAGLEPHAYAVLFFPPRGCETNCADQNFLYQAYNEKATGAEADTLNVAPGTITTGIDAALRTGGQITGRITDANTHNPISGASACAYAEAGGPDACGTANANGEYLIVGLYTESYTMRFTAHGYAATEPKTPVSVTAGATTTGVNSELGPVPTPAPAAISGRVVDANTHQPLAKIQVCATPHVLGGYGCATTGPNGEYTISNLPAGTYIVNFGPIPCETLECEYQNYLFQYYGNKSLETESPQIKLTAGQTASGIDAEMHPGGQITGKVVDAATNLPIAGIIACLVNQTLYDECGITNANGEYAIAALPTGKYQVWFGPYAFAPSCAKTECQPPNYISQYYNGKATEAEAESVSVTVGATASGIDARMQAGGEIAGEVTGADTHAPLSGMTVCASMNFAHGASCGYTSQGATASASSNTLAVPAPSTPTTTGQTGTTVAPTSTNTPAGGNPGTTANSKPKAPTTAQKLAKALNACKKIKAKGKRKRCEAQARKRYARKHSRKTHRRGK